MYSCFEFFDLLIHGLTDRLSSFQKFSVFEHSLIQACNIHHYYMALSHKDWELPNSRI